MPASKRTALLKGMGNFGRFLLRDYFVQKSKPFCIKVINDTKLTAAQIRDLLVSDRHAKCFPGLKVIVDGKLLVISLPDGHEEHILITHGPAELAEHVGTTDMFFECSGEAKNDAELVRPYAVRATKVVLISETAYNADMTLVYGFNHEAFNPSEHVLVSYGSCTVNPGVLLLDFFHKQFGVAWAAVDVIHNIQAWKLDQNPALREMFEEKFCTLERSGPELLPFLRGKFEVPYRVTGRTGTSAMRFKVRLKRPPTTEGAVETIEKGIGHGGALHRLIGMTPRDTGPEAHDGTPYCAVIIEDKVRMVADTLCFGAYFDNDASGSQFGRAARYIVNKL